MNPKMMTCTWMVLAGTLLLGQEPGKPPELAPQAAPAPRPAGAVRPFYMPPEMVTKLQDMRLRTGGSDRQTLQRLLEMTFTPREQGGLGMVYDNERTRTVEEVWLERKANCISLTAFFLEVSRMLGIRSLPAEAQNTIRWRRVGTDVHLERHVVALVPVPGGQDLVADFLPQVRRRMGVYQVALLTQARFEALFVLNLAVEAKELGDDDAAWAVTDQVEKLDPTLGSLWNFRCVLSLRRGDLKEAEKHALKALSLDARDFVAMGNLEIVLRNGGRAGEAEAIRKKSARLRQRDPYFQAFLAEEALQEGRLGDALQCIKRALRIHEADPEFHLLRARIALAENDVDVAAKELEEAKRWALPQEQERYQNKMDALKRTPK